MTYAERLAKRRTRAETWDAKAQEALDAEIETSNSQLVGVQGDTITVIMPKTSMTPTEALRHAAWLVTLAEGWPEYRGEFEKVLAAVRGT